MHLLMESEATAFAVKVQKTLALEAYRASVKMAQKEKEKTR